MEDLQQQGTSEKKGPTSLEWDLHRQEIIDLYLQKKLDEVRDHMLTKYAFNASLRMFRSRLKAWNATKNWKAKEKNELLQQLRDNPIELDKKKMRKLRRHLHALRIRDAQCAEEDDSSDSYADVMDDFSDGYVEVMDDSDIDLDVDEVVKPRSMPKEANLNEWYSSSRATRASSPDLGSFTVSTSYTSRTRSGMLSTPPNIDLTGIGTHFSTSFLPACTIFNSDIDPQLHTMNLVLKNIQRLFTGRLYSTDERLEVQGKKFWNDVEYAIYLLKVSAPARAWPTIDKACDTSASSLELESVRSIQAMLALLSPVNTKHCPGLRKELLRYLSGLAEVKHGNAHPVVMMVTHLQHDKHTRELSERSLRYMLALFSAQSGPCHRSSITTHTELVRTLRRDGHLDAASIAAKQLLDAVCTGFGTMSLQARKATREVAHVLMDCAEWKKALELCFSVVGHDESKTAPTIPQYMDACAVYAMEDMSKIYGMLGDIPLSIVWLEKAVSVAWTLWPKGSIAVEHVVDKLDGMLRQCGRLDEAELWRVKSAA